MRRTTTRTLPRLSQTIRLLRYKTAAPYIGCNVLDVGCGPAFVLDLVPGVDQYVGLDTHTRLLQFAREAFPHHQFYQIDLECDPLPTEVTARRFDTITMLAVLEHLADPLRLVQPLADLLLPGGRLVATTPTPLGHRLHRLGSLMGYFHHEAVEEHKSILDRHSLTAMLQAAGLRVTRYHQFEAGCNQLVVGVR